MSLTDQLISISKHRIRVLLTTFLSLVLFLRSKKCVISRSDSLVIISPHQDDESLGCTGAIASKSTIGGPLNIAYVTDGSASHKDFPAFSVLELSNSRKMESELAMRHLGVKADNLYFFDLLDGTLDHMNTNDRAMFISNLSDYLRSIKPSIIMLPCRSDGSSEHNAVFKLVSEAVFQSDITVRFLEYPVWSWWNSKLLIKPTFSCKKVWRISSPNLKRTRSIVLSYYKTQFLTSPNMGASVLSNKFLRLFIRNHEYYFEW